MSGCCWICERSAIEDQREDFGLHETYKAEYRSGRGAEGGGLGPRIP
jgi:hypothetical protein